MKQELEHVLQAAQTLPAAALPELLGDLEQIRVTALARLTAPAPATSSPDTLLNVREAAERLGMSKGYLYRHHSMFPFARREGRALRFSSRGIETYLAGGAKRVSKRGNF
jgi:predicted DNA-binding transcriptional regulator AlpA